MLILFDLDFCKPHFVEDFQFNFDEQGIAVLEMKIEISNFDAKK